VAANGTSFQIGISADAGSLPAAASSVDAFARKLDEAGGAATKAAQMVSAGEDAYKRAEAAALGAAKAVEKNALKLEELRAKQQKAMEGGDEAAFWRAAAAVEALGQKQTVAKTRAEELGRAFDNEANNLDRLRQASQKAAAGVDDLSKKHKEAASAEQKAAKEADELAKKQKLAAEGSGKLNEAAEGFGKLGGPIGMLGQKALGTAEGINKLFASAGAGKAILALTAAGVVGLVVALASLALGLAVGLVKIGAWAVGLSDASRSAGLLSQGIAQSVYGGLQLEGALDRMQNRFPQTREELQGMAADLAKTGLKGKALEDALDDAATKAAKLKFGPEWERQVNALPNLSKRFQQNVAGIFGGLNVDGLLGKLGELVNLFDKNTATGKAIKVVFESLFQPAINGVEGFIPKVIAAFIQFEIWVLKALIAIKPFGSKIEMIGQLVLAAGATIATFAAVSIAGIVALGIAIATPVLAFMDLWNAGKSAYDKLSQMSFSEIGTMLIDGLVGGITGGIGKVIEAVTGVASSAIGAAKSALGIASPSKVFAQIGGFTAEGMAAGVDDGVPEVKSSLETMVAPPSAASAGAGALGSGGGGQGSAAAPQTSGATLNVAPGAFVFNGISGVEEAKDFFTSALENMATQLGGVTA
jgi:hypothetical protein